MDSVSRSEKRDGLMAILKILNINASKGGSGKHLKNALYYIMNREKTEKGLIGGMHCVPEPGKAYDTFLETKRYFGKLDKRQAYHFVISFVPGEATPEQAYEITKRFTDEMFKEYEGIYAVHKDKKHVHGHIIFNSVNYIDGYKFRYEKGDWANIYQPVLNRLCEEFGLSQIGIEKERYHGKRVVKGVYEKGRSHNNSSYRNKDDKSFNWSDYIRQDLDELIYECNSMSELIEGLRNRGYRVKGENGVHLSVLPPGKGEGGRYRRVYKLGYDYTEEMLEKRMQIKNKPIPEHFISEESTLCFVFPKRITVPWKSKQRAFSVWQTAMSKYLYNQMTRPKGERLSYKEIRKRQKEITRVHQRMELMNQYQIHDADTLKQAIREKETELDATKLQRKELSDNLRPYRKMISIYKEMKSLKTIHDAYAASGERQFNEEYVKYEKMKAVLDKNNLTYEGMEELLAERDTERKKINGVRRQLFQDLERLNEIKNTFLPENAERQEISEKGKDSQKIK